jgi:hypothetical protein
VNTNTTVSCDLAWVSPKPRELQCPLSSKLGDSDDGLVVPDSCGSPWSPLAAVGQPSRCREGRLTGAVANSHYRADSGHSITSSARTISMLGTLMPSAFAVFRLM